MKPHAPNSIPLPLRAACAGVLVLLLLYVFAGLATGYTYVPSKRGGFFLSGVPTLMVVFAAACACVAATLTLLDHYDRRANEASYAAARRRALALALGAFVAAPLVQLLDVVLRRAGLDVLPAFDGFARHYTLYSPQLRHTLPLLEPLLDAGLLLALASLALFGIALLLHKLRGTQARRAVLTLCSLGLLGLSLFLLAGSTRDFVSGEVRARRHRIQAEAEPAKFNAVLLTRFVVGGVLAIGSLTVLVAAIGGKLPPDAVRDATQRPGQRSKRGGKREPRR